MSAQEKSIIVIGAGLAGLSTATYARMNNFRVKVFELHEYPGGCCTSWEKENYIFDWCISWCLGSGKDNEMREVWDELEALKGKEIRNFEIFNTVVFPSGEKIKFYTDPDVLEAYLLKISPEDSKLITTFCGYVRQFRKSIGIYPMLKTKDLMSIREKIKMGISLLPYIRLFMKTMSVKMMDFAASFKHPLLKEAFNWIFYERLENFPMMPYCFTLASAAEKNSGVPEDGSMGLSKSLEASALHMGAEIFYRKKVEEIIVENNKAVGIRLQDGTEHRADYIVSTNDGYSTIYKLLQGKYTSPFLDKIYNRMLNQTDAVLFPGCVTLFLGVNKDYGIKNPFMSFMLPPEITASLTGSFNCGLTVQIRNQLYPCQAPEGKTVFYITYLSTCEPWRKLVPEAYDEIRKTSSKSYTNRKRTEEYRIEKNRVAQVMIDYLADYFEGLKEAIEVSDISTPLTNLRYTNNFAGSILAWVPFSDELEDLEKYNSKKGPVLPNLGNFYMGGQWTISGCVTRAAANGRHILQYICRQEKKKFQVKPINKPVAMNTKKIEQTVSVSEF